VSEGLRRGMRYAIGAEVDNDPRSRPDAQNIVDAMKPDGMIRSVHFLTIDHPVHGPNWNWAFDNPEFKDVFDIVGTEKTWELYMAALLDAIERLPGNIIGHFYVPAVFGHWPDDATLEKYEDQLVDACEARGMAIEFNTRFLYRDGTEDEKQKYLTVNERLLRKAKAKNVGIAVGSDAHSPKDQGGAFTTVLDVLDACEINEIVFPVAGRLARVALKVEKKPEPEPEPEPPAPPPEEKKPVRKARTSEPPARAKERTAKGSDASSDAAAPKPVSDKPAKASKPKAVAKAAPAPKPVPAPKPAPAPKAAAVKTPPAKAAKPAPKPAAKAPAKPAPKAPAKAAAKPAAKPAAKKPVAKKPAKPAPKPIAKKAAAKAAPAKKAPAKKAPPKKTVPAKKAAPAKKAPPKKVAPKKAAPVKKAAPAKKSAAKKPAAKKSATKRR